MLDLDKTAELVPVSEWVYNLYRVEYWTENAAEGGRLIKTIHLTASCENHLWSDANEYTPHNCNCISIDKVRDDVGHPRAIGMIYGQKVYEGGLAHAKRLTG